MNGFNIIQYSLKIFNQSQSINKIVEMQFILQSDIFYKYFHECSLKLKVFTQVIYVLFMNFYKK